MSVDSICHQLNSCCQCGYKRWIILILAIIELFWFSGYHYGYNALVPVYEDLGVFISRCQPNEVKCPAQEAMFNDAFIVWIALQMLLVTGTGYLMDRIGLRALKLIVTLIYFVGTLMFAFTSRNTSTLFFVAWIFVAPAAMSSLICNHQISSQFPRYRGFVVSLLSGAFDSSGFVAFLVGRTAPGISLQTSFVVLACCALIYGTCMSLFALKRWSSEMGELEKPEEVEDVPEKGDESDTSRNMDPLDVRIQQHMEKRYTSFGSCINSWPFALVTLWFMVALLRFCYFLTQMSQQLAYLFGDDTQTINELQSISAALLMCGFLISPVSGVVLDSSRALFRRRMSRSPMADDAELYWMSLRGIAPAFLVLAVAAVIVSGLIFVKSKITYYIAFVFFVLLRSLLFSASVNFVLIAFPIERFGTVNGLVNTIGGVFSLLQYGIVRMSAVPGNALVAALTILLFISPLVLLTKSR